MKNFKGEEMKRLFIFVGILPVIALISSIATAGEISTDVPVKTEKESNRLIGEVSLDFYSRYVGNMAGGTIFNRPVVQGTVKFSLEPIGLYAKFWGSGNFGRDGGNHFGKEIDWIVGIARPVWKFKIDVAYGYYDLYPQFRSRGDLHALITMISLPNQFVEPYFAIEWDMPVNRKILEGGVFYRIGVTKSISLRKNLALIGDLSLGGNDGPFGFRPDFLAFDRGGLSLCWSPWKSFSVAPQIYYQKRLGHHPSNGGISRDVFWGGVSFNFKHNLLSF